MANIDTTDLEKVYDKENETVLLEGEFGLSELKRIISFLEYQNSLKKTYFEITGELKSFIK
jgi:hypothetical protein